MSESECVRVCVSECGRAGGGGGRAAGAVQH